MKITVQNITVVIDIGKEETAGEKINVCTYTKRT